MIDYARTAKFDKLRLAVGEAATSANSGKVPAYLKNANYQQALHRLSGG